MKKRKILNIICCFALVLCSTLMFAACGFTNPTPGYESGSSAPAPNPDDMPPSSGDDSDIEIDDEGGVASGEIADFSDYFNGYVVLSNGDNTFEVYDEITGAKVKFNDLLNRQIDVLAQDLIYRLTYVYGNRGDLETNLIDILKKDSVDKYYKLNDNFANIKNSNMLINNPEHVNHSDYYANCIDCFQVSLISEDNPFLNPARIMLTGAIEGKYTSLEEEAINTLSSKVANPWKWSLTINDSENFYTKYLETYKNKLKFLIAQILCEKDNLNETYNLEEYNKLLNSINNLGFFDIKDQLVNLIYSYVIGENIKNKDLEIFNCDYFKNNNFKVDSNFQMKAPYNDTELFTETEIQNSPRLYKGYSIVVPAIVSQAINNTFQGTGTSLYPTFARVNGGIGTFKTYEITKPDGEVVQEMTTTGALDLNSIILMPKQGSKPIALNLQVAVARDLKTGNKPSDAGINDLTCYAHDVVVELEVNITYKVHGQDEPVFSQVIQPDGEDSATLTIDSKGYVPTYIDYEDPNFDPTRVDEEGYLDQFKKPMETNGEILPYTYIFSIYDYFPDDMPAFNDYDGYNPEKDTNTLFNNKFQKSEDSVYLDAGPDYVQFTFNIKSIKQYSGDGNQLVDYSGDDIVFDIALMPYTF